MNLKLLAFFVMCAAASAQQPVDGNIKKVAGNSVATSASGVQTVGIVGSTGAAVDGAGQNAAAPANEILVGCQFNQTITFLSTGNMSPCQVDSSGNTKTVISPNNTGLPVNTIAEVQRVAQKSTGSVASINIAIPAAVAAGDSLVVAFCNGNVNAPTSPISDTLGSTWHKAIHQVQGSALECDVWYSVDGLTGSDTVTVTPGGTNASIAMEVYEYSGILAQVPAQNDINSSNSGSSGIAQTVDIVPENGSNSIAVAAIGVGTAAQTITPGTNWTNSSGQQNPTTPAGLFSFVSMSQALDDTDTLTPSATFTSEPWAIAVAVFHAPAIPISGTVRVPGTTPRTTDTALRCVLTSAASTNATNCKAFSGNVYGFRFVNTTATIYYLRMYNSSSAPTCSSSTGFVESIPIPASTSGGGFAFLEPMGEAYTTGIAFCLTGGSGSTDNTNAATGVFGTILYR